MTLSGGVEDWDLKADGWLQNNELVQCWKQVIL